MTPILQVENLRVHFPLDEGTVRAVDGVTFELAEGKTLGIVGESGSGKSVIAQSVMMIVPPPGKTVEGRILLQRNAKNGTSELVDLTRLDPKGKEARGIRGKDVAMIFQEPMSSFSPVHTIGDQISEALTLHSDISKTEARARTVEMLRRVGIPQPERRLDAYPHQLSGGMRQRAMIAMALMCNPRILVADEPTTALDVTIQAQIIELLRSIQEEFGMSILFISHNLGVIAEISHEVLVVYFGKIMERAPAKTLFENPLHPYTKALLKSAPGIDTPVRSRLATIEGTLPDPHSDIPGCPFFDRCTECGGGGAAVCRESAYRLTPAAEDHLVACPRICVAA
jgi:peptide/nickel transport system ATP-binding protein